MSRTYLVTCKPLTVLRSTLFVVCLLVNMLFLLFSAVKLVNAWAAPTLLLFNVEKHHSYVTFSVLITVDLFYCLFWGFPKLHTYTAPWLFVGRVQKRNSYFSVGTLTSKNISDTWFIVCFSLNMLFLPFSGILTWKCINHTCVVAVHALNTPRTPYFFLITAENVTFIFYSLFQVSKHQLYLFSYF